MKKIINTFVAFAFLFNISTAVANPKYKNNKVDKASTETPNHLMTAEKAKVTISPKHKNYIAGTDKNKKTQAVHVKPAHNLSSPQHKNKKH